MEEKYEIIKAHFDDIRTWLASGLTQKQCVKNLGIRYEDWKKCRDNYVEFAELIKSARVRACTQLKNSMFENAIGHTRTVKKGMKVKRVDYNKEGKRIREYEEVQIYEETVYVPPNYKAGVYLLSHWAGKEGYTANDPQAIELRKKELELKEKAANENWG